MTPAQIKAKELVDKFENYVQDKDFFGDNSIKQNSKQCALIAVDEIIKNIDATILYHKESTALPINMKFWQKVKNEINNL